MVCTTSGLKVRSLNGLKLSETTTLLLLNSNPPNFIWFLRYNLPIATSFRIKEDRNFAGSSFCLRILEKETKKDKKEKKMSFTGTTDKCNVCDKTVYVVDMLSIEGMPYHKSCFRCTHCKGTLQMSNYSSMDGVLYCKTHFEQLFKESGNFSKNFQPGKTEKPELTKTPSKISSAFCGTQDKCAACDKTVYPLEKVQMEGECFHKTCFRCAHGGCTLTHSSYASLDSVLYCRHHFNQLFMEKGNYAHVLQSTNHRRTASGNTLPPEATENIAVEAKEENGVSES